MLAGRQALELKTHSIRRGSGEREGAAETLQDILTYITPKPISHARTRLYLIKTNLQICASTCECDVFRPFLAKSDRSSGGTAQPVSWHLPCQEQEEEGGEGEREKNRGSMSWCEGGKTQLPLCLSPVLLLKEWEGGEGASRETAGTICTCLLYSSPHLYTERGWCAQCSNERRGGAFWGPMLLRGEGVRLCSDAEITFCPQKFGGHLLAYLLYLSVCVLI